MLPFVLLGVGVTTSLWGSIKAIGAAMESSEADDINASARGTVRAVDARLEASKRASNENLAALGGRKYAAIALTLKKFVEAYGQLKNVELVAKNDLDRLLIGDFDAAAVKEIRDEVSMLENSAMGLGAGAASGALVAFGAFNGTTMLASAGTGTAISSLSGVAATNATLAWLGGGTVAAGGLGMAGGIMVLGSLVAGPALAIFGSILDSGSTEKMSNAKANQAEAKKYESTCEAVIAKLDAISLVAKFSDETLSLSRTACRRASEKLALVIAQSGSDYLAFSDEEKSAVFKAVKLAQLVKAIVDTPILDKDGNLLGDSEASLKKFREVVA